MVNNPITPPPPFPTTVVHCKSWRDSLLFLFQRPAEDSEEEDEDVSSDDWTHVCEDPTDFLPG